MKIKINTRYKEIWHNFCFTALMSRSRAGLALTCNRIEYVYHVCHTGLDINVWFVLCSCTDACCMRECVHALMYMLHALGYMQVLCYLRTYVVLLGSKTLQCVLKQISTWIHWVFKQNPTKNNWLPTRTVGSKFGAYIFTSTAAKFDFDTGVPLFHMHW